MNEYKQNTLLVFKQDKPKRFQYKPRHQSEEKESVKASFEEKWLQQRQDARHKHFKLSRMGLLVILLIVVLILMYVLSTIPDDYEIF